MGLQLAQEAADLQHWRSTAGAAAIAAVKRAQPQLAPFAMVAEPVEHGVHLTVSGPSADEVQRAVGHASAQSKKSGLAARLEIDWSARHEVVPGGEGTAEPADHGSPCYVAGICLCSEEGKKLRSRANTCVKHVKAVCPYGTTDRSNVFAKG